MPPPPPPIFRHLSLSEIRKGCQLLVGEDLPACSLIGRSDAPDVVVGLIFGVAWVLIRFPIEAFQVLKPEGRPDSSSWSGLCPDMNWELHESHLHFAWVSFSCSLPSAGVPLSLKPHQSVFLLQERLNVSRKDESRLTVCSPGRVTLRYIHFVHTVGIKIGHM